MISLELFYSILYQWDYTWNYKKNQNFQLEPICSNFSTKNFSLNVALELNFRSKLINFSFVTILAWPVVVLEMNKISEPIKTKLFRFYIAIQIGHVKDIKCDLIPKREIGYNIKNRNKSFFHCRTELKFYFSHILLRLSIA